MKRLKIYFKNGKVEEIEEVKKYVIFGDTLEICLNHSINCGLIDIASFGLDYNQIEKIEEICKVK